MTKKKLLTKKPQTRIDTERKEAILELVNESQHVAAYVLECGSAFAHDCHKVDDLSRKVAKLMNFRTPKEGWGRYTL